jgi:hypothetical protein
MQSVLGIWLATMLAVLAFDKEVLYPVFPAQVDPQIRFPAAVRFAAMLGYFPVEEIEKDLPAAGRKKIADRGISVAVQIVRGVDAVQGGAGIVEPGKLPPAGLRCDGKWNRQICESLNRYEVGLAHKNKAAHRRYLSPDIRVVGETLHLRGPRKLFLGARPPHDFNSESLSLQRGAQVSDIFAMSNDENPLYRVA